MEKKSSGPDRSNQPPYSLKPKPDQSRTPALFNSGKAEREAREAAEDKFEVSRGWFMRFGKGSRLSPQYKVQEAAARADVKPAAKLSRRPSEDILGGGHPKQTPDKLYSQSGLLLYFSVDKLSTPPSGTRCGP